MVNRNDDSFKIPIEVLNDCFGRFFMVEDDRPFYDRIFFCTYLEQAYWFYTDCWVDNDKKLRKVSFARFIQQIVDNFDVDIPNGGTAQQLVSEFTSFKFRVGTYGAILVDPTLSKVLLVQSFNGQSWGFPKGKIEEKETFVDCAVREVKEEIDYDISPYVNPEMFLELKSAEQTTRLYIIFGVAESTKFKTNTRKEIAEIKWFDLHMLPANKGDKRPLVNTGYSPNNFYLILPFVKFLRNEVKLMETRCKETFGTPIYNQKDFHEEFLQVYYPRVYKIQVQREKKLRLEREKKKARNPNDPSEKTFKQLQEEEKMQRQKPTSDVLMMLHNATLRQEDLKKQSVKTNTTASENAADCDEPQKFRFKSLLTSRPDDGTPGTATGTDPTAPRTAPLLSTDTSSSGTASLLGSTAPPLHGNTTASLLGNTSSLLGNTTSSLLGNTTSSLLGNTTSSLLGNTTSSLLGNTTSSLLGNTTSSLLGNTTTFLSSEATPPPDSSASAPADSAAPMKPSPSKRSRGAGSVFPEVPLQRSRTWDNARLDFTDVLNAVEVAWRASYAPVSTGSAGAVKKKHRGKENKY